MKSRILIAALLLSVTLGSAAAERTIPKNYYTRMDGKTSSALKTATCEVIYPHTKHSYSSLWTYFEYTDVKPDGIEWWEMYSNETFYLRNGNSGMNKEHSVPKSWWGGSKNNAYTDLNHLFPSEMKANSAKSNYPMGEVDQTKKVTFNNGCSMVGTPVSGQGGGSDKVFEPDDRYKGDLARAYMYMATCYQDLNWEKTYMMQNNTYPSLTSWTIDLLLKWHREDPVSQKEIDRNEAVYKHQGNRNPFIDFPQLAEYIWGNKTGEKFILADHINGTEPDPNPEPEPEPEPTVEAKLILPAPGFVLEFGEVACSNEGSAILLIRGENLNENKSLRLAIYDSAETDDASLFTIDGAYSQTVSSAVANSADGLSVRIDYKPVSTGEHNSYLQISRGGLENAVNISLHGYCLPTPQLCAPTALPATDITETSYTANWRAVAGEEIDHFVVNRTKYIGGAAETMQIEVEGDTSLEITDFCGSESYTVQSVRLGVMSPQSESISVTPSSITGVEANTRFGVTPYPDGLLLTCSQPIERLIICDPSGRTIRSISNAANNDFIALPAGIYIIKASGITAPIKTVVK